jgi:hypothetical protein
LAPPAGASAEASGQQQQQQQQPAILSELGVSLDSLEQLLTGDCGVSSQQPVWMVVNLQGKIKGSYSASKMVEFSRRGTLSAAQLILGIDKDLPYVSRQVGGGAQPLRATVCVYVQQQVWGPKVLGLTCRIFVNGGSGGRCLWQEVGVPPSEEAASTARILMV